MKNILFILILASQIYGSKFVVDSVTIKNDSLNVHVLNTGDTFNVSISDTLLPVIVKDSSNNSLDIKCFGGVLVFNFFDYLYEYDSIYTFVNRDTIPTTGGYKQVILFKTVGDTIKTAAGGFWVMDKAEFANIYYVIDTTAITDKGTQLTTRSSQTYRSARSTVWRQPTVTVNEGVTTLLIFLGHTPLENSQGASSANLSFKNELPLLPDSYYLLEIDNRSSTASSVVTFFISWYEIDPNACPR